jgi:hypothetical protein
MPILQASVMIHSVSSDVLPSARRNALQIQILDSGSIDSAAMSHRLGDALRAS